MFASPEWSAVLVSKRSGRKRLRIVRSDRAPFLAAEQDNATPLLEFRDVRRHFEIGDEVVRAVDGVSLRIDAGELVALYGPSGSGKSTLLNIAAALERPGAGGVFVNGVDVTKLSEKDASRYRMHLLGWVGQESDLIDGASAVENAAFKLICAGHPVLQARRDAASLLKAVGFGQRLGQRAETLSMGERQRVMIARALSMDPQVVLADEPTGNLDSRRTHEIFDLLRTMTHERRMATLIVTHDVQARDYADEVYTLKDGVLHDFEPERSPDR
jgi:putative ABC transport system ATP-binding protein